MAVARRLKPSRATAVLKSNLIRSIEFGTAVARRLKRALQLQLKINFVTLYIFLRYLGRCQFRLSKISGTKDSSEFSQIPWR